MRVRAIQRGWYDNVLREPGREFEIPEELFSARWMEPAEPSPVPPPPPPESKEKGRGKKDD